VLLHPLFDTLHLLLEGIHFVADLQLEHSRHFAVVDVVLLLLIFGFQGSGRDIGGGFALLGLERLLGSLELVTLLLGRLPRRYLGHKQVVLQSYPRIVYYPRSSQIFARLPRTLAYLQVTHRLVRVAVDLLHTLPLLKGRILHHVSANLESPILSLE
jgi:hypothetical protein